MSECNVKLNKTDMIALLSENGAMANVVTQVINQVLDSQCADQLQADRYERNAGRLDHRNGYRTRSLYSRVGPLTLRVPQTRNGTFSTDIFNKYQRSEKALVASLMEMYLQGVSTRKVTNITEELCGTSFSKSQVSYLVGRLDPIISAWRNRDLSGQVYPFLIVDALVVDVRRDHAIRPSGFLIAYGITDQGEREVLDFMLADSESSSSWDDLFKRLKSRHLGAVDIVVSDAHSGLVSALRKNFQGAQWQRCQVHFMRNVLGACPRHKRKQLADKLSLVFKAGDAKTARKLAVDIIDEFEGSAGKAMEILESGLDQSLTVLSVPSRYRRKLRTTNLAERLNSEIRRRQRVVRIFPNEAAAERLIGALLMEVHETWQEGNKYFDMTEYKDWKAEQFNLANDAKNIVSIGA